MASRYEIHFGVSTSFGAHSAQALNAADDQLVSLVASLRSTLEAVAEGKAGSQEAVAALAALSES